MVMHLIHFAHYSGRFASIDIPDIPFFSWFANYSADDFSLTFFNRPLGFLASGDSLSDTPEPAAGLLFAAGLAMLIARRLRRVSATN